MLFSYIQSGFVSSNRFDFSSKRISRKASGFIFAIIVIAHGVLIILVLNSKSKSQEYTATETLLQLVELSPEKHLLRAELEEPEVIFQFNTIHSKLPDIDIKDIPLRGADLGDYLSTVPYELPNSNDARYRDVFDPKLRQKLIDAQAINKPRAKEKSTSWTEIDGRTFVDMGNGECLVSMQKVDSRERGTNWGMTRCGKTDSEKIMDNVTADLEARKHPLQTQ